MAASIRPLLMRASKIAAPTRRLLDSRAASFQPTSSGLCRRPELQEAFRALAKPSRCARGSPSIVQVAAFHVTARRAILPPLPQRINGTANEAAPVPIPSPSHGAYHWSMERAVSALLIPVTIAPFVGGTAFPVIDALLCGLLVIHTHIGFQSIIIDYIPKKRLPKTRVAFEYGLYAASAVVAVGLFEFETNDVGLSEAIVKIWHA